MPELTIEQRARRRTARKNNALRRAMPLFAEALHPDGAMSDWLTTHAVECAAVARQQASAVAHLAAIAAATAGRRAQEDALRREATSARAPAEVAFLDARRRIYPDDPSYGIEFWRRVIRQPDWVEREQERLDDIRRRGDIWRARLSAGPATP